MTPPRRLVSTLAVSLAALCLAHGPLGAGELIDRILLHVNSRVITQSAFDSRVEAALKDSPAGLDATHREELKKSVMSELVHEALLEDRARELDLGASDAEVEDQIKRLKDQNKVGSDEEFAQALASSGLTPERLRDQLKKSLTVQRIVGREVNSKVDLSDDALRVVYEREKENWKIPEKLRLAEVLIGAGDGAQGRAGAEQKAKDAALAVKGGTRFEEVVTRFSEGPTRSRGGDLGTVAKGELSPEIDTAVFGLATGGVTDPILTRSGWHIVKVLEKLPATYKPFSEVKPEIFKKEQETQFQKKLAEYLDKLEREAVIRVSGEASPYYQPPAAAPSSSGRP